MEMTAVKEKTLYERMAESNKAYWLEMKVKIEQNNPLLEIKKKFGDQIVKVTPHLHPANDEHLFRIEIKNPTFNLVDFIEQRAIGFENESLERVGNNIIYGWFKSPSCDLVKECLLKGYGIYSKPSHEHFFISRYGNKKHFLELLRNAFIQSGASPENFKDKLDWSFSFMNKIIPSGYPNLTLLQNYKHSFAVLNDYFMNGKRNYERLSPIIEEIKVVTGKKPDIGKLVQEIEEIGNKIIDHITKKSPPTKLSS